MRDDIFLIGVSMTPFGKLLDRSVKSLVAQTVGDALSDADATIPDVGVAFYANSTQAIIDGQHSVRGQMALRSMGFQNIPIINVENACAGGATALHQAIAYLKAGLADVALAVGVEKMVDPDKRKSTAIFDGAWDVHETGAVAEALGSIGNGMPVPAGKESGVKSPFMELYASITRGHMARFGTTERQLAIVASKNHQHSTMNPLSQYQKSMSVEEVLAGPLICWPLTLPMCSPISDGASAAIVCTRSALERFSKSRALRVLASVLVSGSDRDWSDFGNHLCRNAANKAYDLAGIGPKDISVAEVHDASSFGEIIQTENLGFCELGQGGWFAERGETSLGGSIPINPSGGLESKGHPIAASGLGQIYELALHLRGIAGARQVSGSRFALAENGGGFQGVEEAVAAVTILGR
ncbi:MAG: thiolase [Hydrocarboniphaga sp.]|nr:thiolase [Hydrocarboniphaga sp.]